MTFAAIRHVFWTLSAIGAPLGELTARPRPLAGGVGAGCPTQEHRTRSGPLVSNFCLSGLRNALRDCANVVYNDIAP